jgi:hypothetical protein
MTGREKVLAAFRPEGTPEIGGVSCYDDIFIRDHWFALTDVPWWYPHSGGVERNREIGSESTMLPACAFYACRVQRGGPAGVRRERERYSHPNVRGEPVL